MLLLACPCHGDDLLFRSYWSEYSPWHWHGIGIQAVIKSKFGCPVTPVTRGHVFLLVASFDRCKFKLSPSSVGAILQATIGGVAEDFDVLPHLCRMVRAIAPRRPRLRNEDLAIVTISLLPGNPLYFPAVEEVVREFLVNRRVQIKEVQPCPLGQAFVRFENEYDRDRMVLQSPHPYGGVDFSFVGHNQGRNWRRVLFNHECLLMLMGLPEDFWEQEFIESVLGPCARVVRWENDPDHLARLLVRVRVTDLETIPHFSVFSDGIGFDSQSWTVQIEILQHENLGGGPPDEEQVTIPPEDAPCLTFSV